MKTASRGSASGLPSRRFADAVHGHLRRWRESGEFEEGRAEIGDIDEVVDAAPGGEVLAPANRQRDA